MFLHSKPAVGKSKRVANALKGDVSGLTADTTYDIEVFDSCSGSSLSEWSGSLTTDADGMAAVYTNWGDIDTVEALNSGSPWALSISESGTQVACCVFSETRIKIDD